MMTLMTVLGDTQSALTMRASSDNLQQHPQPTFDNLDDNLGDDNIKPDVNLRRPSDDLRQPNDDARWPQTSS